MAVLDPKDAVLRLLDPQPQDGTGPGYISALDLKTVCSNLYDQIERVNVDVALVPDRELIVRLVDAMEAAERSRERLLAPLIDEFGRPRTNLSADDLVKLLVRFVLDNPDLVALTPGVTIFDPDVVTAAEINAKYYSPLPVRWGNAVCTINGKLYHWNSVSFEEVGQIPTALPDPFGIVPGALFPCRNLHELTPAELFSFGLRGNDLNWPVSPAGAGNFFTLAGTGFSKEYYWVVPAAPGQDGYFEEGRQP